MFCRRSVYNLQSVECFRAESRVITDDEKETTLSYGGCSKATKSV